MGVGIGILKRRRVKFVTEEKEVDFFDIDREQLEILKEIKSLLVDTNRELREIKVRTQEMSK